MANKEFMPHRSYLIEVLINGEYIKNQDIKMVKITSSLTSYCPTVELELTLSSALINQNKMYGQDPIKLQINLLGQGGISLEYHEFELLCTRITYGSPLIVSMGYGKQVEKTKVNISTVIRAPFISMTTLVNGVYGGLDTPKTVKQVVEDLVSKTSATLVYDTEGENLEPIDQVCIPPRTLYDSILYLDETFGSHDGAPAVFCRKDNSIHVINLSKRINKSFVAKVSQPSMDKKDDAMEKQSMDGINSYITGTFKHDFVGNSKFAAIGTTLRFVSKPSDKLSHVIEYEIKDICKECGVIYKNPEFYVDPGIKRTKVIENNTGYELTETFVKSILAKKIFDMASVSFSVGGVIFIENFLKLGEPIYINPLSLEYLDFSGKYILYKSIITYARVQEGDWNATISADVVRTNKTI